MSKKTKARRGNPAGQAVAGGQAAAGKAPAAAASKAPADQAPQSGRSRTEADAIVERVLSSLWSAIAASDPLRAELETASCLAIPRVAGQQDPGEIETFISTVLVDGAVRRHTPDGAALLRLLMALGTHDTKRAASKALAELTSAGVYPPDWVTEIGKVTPGQAWRRYDVFGDDEAIAVTFGYGEAEHGVVVQVDLAGIPVATAIGVSTNAARLIEAISGDSEEHDRSEQIGLAEARRRLLGPLDRSDRDPTPDLSTDSLAYLPIARSRVRRLPADDTVPGPVFTAADRAAAVDEFMKSPLAAEAVAADEESTRFWAEVLTGYSGRVPGEPPAQVGPRKLAHILLGHVPNTFVLSPAQRSSPRARGDRVGPLVRRKAGPGRGRDRDPGGSSAEGAQPVRPGLRRPGRGRDPRLRLRPGRQRRRRGLALRQRGAPHVRVADAGAARSARPRRPG